MRASCGALLLGGLTALGAGCVHPLAALTQRRSVTNPTGQFELAFSADAANDENEVARSLERAGPALAQWGTLEHQVTVFVLPSHGLFESAVRRVGYDWLRAWATWDELFVQAPSSWGATGAHEDEFAALILHELTHCLMFQRSASKDRWLSTEIPLWFREGMATWTAKQGSRFPSLEDLARFYETHPDDDPMLAPDSLYQHHSDVVYAAAHQSFSFLIRRYGQEAVSKLLDAVRGEQTFPQAFEAVIGIGTSDFAREFRHYLLWRGFRGARPAAVDSLR